MGKPLDWMIWSTKTHSYTGKNDYKQTVLSYYMKSYRPRKKILHEFAIYLCLWLF